MKNTFINILAGIIIIAMIFVGLLAGTLITNALFGETPVQIITRWRAEDAGDAEDNFDGDGLTDIQNSEPTAETE